MQRNIVFFPAGSERGTLVVQWRLSPRCKKVAGSVPRQACLCGLPALCVLSLCVSFGWSLSNYSQVFGESVFSLFLITFYIIVIPQGSATDTVNFLGSVAVGSDVVKW